MKSTPTPHTHTGRTIREVTAQVGGPSRLKEDLTVPAGTLVRFIGRWVVSDLSWLAKSIGEEMEKRVGKYPNTSTEQLGRNSITYHDADHYGIEIENVNVDAVKVVGR